MRVLQPPDAPSSSLSLHHKNAVVLSIIWSLMLTTSVVLHAHYAGDESMEEKMVLAYYIISQIHYLMTALLTIVALLMVRKVYNQQVSHTGLIVNLCYCYCKEF